MRNQKTTCRVWAVSPACPDKTDMPDLTGLTIPFPHKGPEVPFNGLFPDFGGFVTPYGA